MKVIDDNNAVFSTFAKEPFDRRVFIVRANTHTHFREHFNNVRAISYERTVLKLKDATVHKKSDTRPQLNANLCVCLYFVIIAVH
jgi:hypothetical protein